MTRLQTLEINGICGIKNLSLPFDGGSLVLGGGNGTGKSACVDAIDFLYTGHISTLTGVSAISLRQHGAHIHSRLEDAYVSATFDYPGSTATRWLSGSVQVEEGLQIHMQRGRTLPFILRRAQLQQFIHTRAADRYRSMADLIGTEGLEETEAALKHARDELEKYLRAQEMELARVERQISDVPSEELSESAILVEASRALEKLSPGSYTLETVKDIDSVRAAILASITDTPGDPRTQAQSRLVAELRRGIGGEGLRRALRNYQALTRTVRVDANRGQMLGLLQVLKRGKEYLAQVNTSQCPLCRQSVEGQQLLLQLVNRVAELEEVSLQQNRLDTAREDLDSALQDVTVRARSLEPLFVESEAGTSAISSLLNSAAMLRESLRARALIESAEMAGRMDSALGEWEERAEAYCSSRTSMAPTEHASSSSKGAPEALKILENLRIQMARLERGRQESLRLESDRDRLQIEVRRSQAPLAMADAVYRIFNSVKNEEIQNIYNQLRSDLARMYDFLHPGEGQNAIAIEIDLRKRGSSELKMGFHDRDEEDPRAYSSEGHLDSLGLCIFLAFARRFTNDWPLLVLDDVVTAVDAAHKRRIARLLFEEFGDRQLFITTHDSRWFADLRAVQTETGQETVRNIVIEKWTVDSGPSIRVVDT